MFKILIVDPMIHKIETEIQVVKPANVRLLCKTDRTPPNTLACPHFVLVCGRTPAEWVVAYRNFFHNPKYRVIDMGDHPGAEAYIKKIDELSHRNWFET